MEAEAGSAGRRPHRRPRLSRKERELEFARIVAFSDGVFAIAITLLVLALQIPQGVSDLPQALKDQLPDFFAFALSFAVLARIWYFHHRFFGALSRYDHVLININFLYLALVTLVPFTSQVIGDYGEHSEAAILYAVNMSALGAIGAMMVRYTFRHGLIDLEDAEALGVRRGAAGWLVAAAFAISIPIALIGANAAELSWFVLLVGGGLLLRRMEARTRPGR
ncbi:MAG TPA: TMEM175 family protein [Solirubrobacterales bacterium]|nr:TMEM175 family protein [Solirubrobacterales bacterium]